MLRRRSPGPPKVVDAVAPLTEIELLGQQIADAVAKIGEQVAVLRSQDTVNAHDNDNDDGGSQ